MLVLLGALREEIADLPRRMDFEEVAAGQDFCLYRSKEPGRDILMVQTGMGRQRAETATRFVLKHYPVTSLVSLGFAGALNEELKAGDVVICSTLHYSHQSFPETTGLETYVSDASLVSLAVQTLAGTAVPFHCGSGVTVPQPVSRPEQKRQLGEAFKADVVDMETYWIARIATDRQIPFIAIRAISDTGGDNLPPFIEMLTANGTGQWQRAVLYLSRHPWHLIKLLTLYRHARQARRNLTTFVGYFITRLVPQSGV